MENKNHLFEATAQELQDALQVLKIKSAIDERKVLPTSISVSLDGHIILEMREKDFHFSFNVKITNGEYHLLYNDFVVELTPEQIEVVKNVTYEQNYIYYSLIK